jgi:hypothetical protein
MNGAIPPLPQYIFMAWCTNLPLLLLLLLLLLNKLTRQPKSWNGCYAHSSFSKFHLTTNSLFPSSSWLHYITSAHLGVLEGERGEREREREGTTFRKLHH